MKMFLWNVLLMVFWAAVTQDISLLNLAGGFLIAFIVLYILKSGDPGVRYFSKVRRSGLFLLFYIRELVSASIRIAFDVVTPPYYMNPGVIAVPLDARSNVEITLLANLLSLTPGSLSLDVSDDRQTLYVHTMFVDGKDVERFRRNVKRRFETRVLELLR